MKNKQKVLVIVGPTSSGKSALAVSLAKKFRGEIISADSRQVYRGLDIGAGKITKRDMRGVAHHLLDVASPKKNFTAHEFAEKSRDALRDIISRRKLPIVVGGTGFYIDALVGRIALPDVPPNKRLRARLEKKTAVQLFKMLQKSDPRRAKTIDPHNKRRLIRALEIGAALGKSPAPKEKVAYDAFWVGLQPEQKTLERMINARLKERIRQGVIAEGESLHANGLSYRRMQELGLEYRSLARLLRREIRPKEFEEELQRDIRRYAKKQLAYWKRNKNIEWSDPSEEKRIARAITTWLKQ